MDAQAGQQKKDSQINIQLKSIQNAVELLNERIGILRLALNTVIRPIPNQPEGVNEKGEELVPLAQELSKVARSIYSSANEINSIFGGLEL